MTSKTAESFPLLLTTDEVAKVLKCCTKTVTNLVTRGQIKAVRVGKNVRVEDAELQRFIAQGGAR